ncbi:MAG: D-alanyl-D-alanine carboxypeptidase/D-alanyl-D-alanine-endopeptidase [Prevotella sp.]|jgi:D-alanyl-D-alanine carboxypeptidase/D-alanyl-D-alanine-endopeptidase (penicillin-binding protein 4)|nr:D-alanyl-D-alanine carboxypeptidase/D-alanyl-D-alanine-endopeptidase [Muribaculaceae bacterium]MBQ1828854.1 D-alanyl-D-alanine carboxypeptidase/D-alanyl-D-alanine-endopeptidase [Prevotella sp.]MBQ5495022.1 D-alanyl-D-alanine carboxypeptidase/D-alanyl-D-alanine-endopeptidase [Prevotella sp.]MBQ5548032.1 D-alanyl-D-alanine carboxypeptidase/D-alanyl-D-alanine-endopeptidase [Prevotella sp.]
MKKYLLLLISWGVFASVAAQDSLRGRLDSLLCDPMFETSQVGLMVYDLTADSALFTYNHRQLMRPASCMKLVTAITALDQLGANYDYQTRIYMTGNVNYSTLEGNIYCVGGFDPTLTIDDVAVLANCVSRLGIDSIHGLIVADRTMKEALDYGEGWCWDDENPMLNALSIGRKYNFLETFAEEVARAGINLERVQLTEGRVPQNAQLIATFRHNISQILDRMMKKSDNFYAESMFYQTAASARKGLARARDARDITKRLIARLGLGDNPYKIADGSGLSLYNYVSTELLCTLLRHAWRSPSIQDALLPSLPIAGVDGTLKDRMKKTSAQGNVRAKTGTVTGISSLAGYCTAANGHQLCFAIINQGIMRAAAGKAFQDRVCKVLCDYE